VITAPAAKPSTVSPGASHPATGILRGALALLTTQPLTWGASLLGAILLPRYLGAHGLGEYTAAITIANLVGIATSFGLPSFFVRQIAQAPRAPRTYVSAGIVLVTGLSLLSAIVLSLVLPRTGLPVRPELLAIVLGGTVVGGVQSIVLAVLIGQERHALYAWLNAGTVALTAIVGISILAAGGGIMLFAVSSVAISGAAVGIGWRLCGLRLNQTAFSPPLWGTVVRGGIPFLGWNLALNVYGEIDKVLLAVLSRAAEVGWYAAAYRIIAIPVFIPTLITTPLLPALSRRADDHPLFVGLLRASLIAALILTVPIAAVIIAVAPIVPALLHWPAEFDHSVPLMMILALHQPFVAADMVLATGLAALKREGRWLRVGIVAAVINPALNVVFIPLLERHMQDGAIAAAVITVGTELLMFGAAVRLLPRDFFTRSVASVILRILIAGVLCCLITAWLRGGSLPGAAFAGGLTFITAILAMRAVSAEDLRRIAAVGSESLKRRLSTARRAD
jgi:O-antigen/teichoic acid export membrane protein